MPSIQPRVVRIAVIVVVVSAVLTVLQAVSTLQNVGSEQTVDALNKALSASWASSELSVTALQTMLKVSANLAAVIAAAMAVLAIHAWRGSRQARTGLVVLMVPMFVAGLMAGGWLVLPMAAAVALLFSRTAKPWFAPAWGTATSIPVGSPTPVDLPAYAPGVTSVMPPYPTPPVPVAPSGRRPGIVTAAGVIAIVLSTLTSLVGLIAGGGLIASSNSAAFQTRIHDELHRRNFNIATADLERAITVVGWVFLAVGVLSLLGVVAGALTLRGNNGMRILLIVLASLTGVVSVFTITSGISLIWLVGAILVVVFLVRDSAQAWFRQR